MDSIKNAFYTAVVVLIGLVFTQCKNKEKAVIETVEVGECQPMNMDREAYAASYSDTSYTVLNAKVVDGCLGVHLIYDQQCENEKVELLWDYRIMKSLPPQAPLRIRIQQEEPCKASKKAMKKTWFWFELSELRSPIYGGEIILRVNGYQEPISFKYLEN